MNIYRHLYEIISSNNYSTKIITSDFDAWIYLPEYRHVYNKLWLAESQYIDCGPMGIYPKKYPIIFKPIINLYGMSRSVIKINNEQEYEDNMKDGLFWEEYLGDTHYCVDIIMKNGKVLFTSCLVSVKDDTYGDRGIFNYHYTDRNYQLPDHIKLWLATFLKNYTGLLNLEIISGVIIEAHLRLNGDFQMYNDKFVEILHYFYEDGLEEIDYLPKDIYLVPIFVDKKRKLIDRSTILNILSGTKIDTIHWDDIYSMHQSESVSRLLIFSVWKQDDSIENIMEIKKRIIYLVNI